MPLLSILGMLLMFATEFSDAFTVVPEFLDASYCSYQSSLMPLLIIQEFSDAITVHTRVL